MNENGYGVVEILAIIILVVIAANIFVRVF